MIKNRPILFNHPLQDGYHYKAVFTSKAYDESKDTDFYHHYQRIKLFNTIIADFRKLLIFSKHLRLSVKIKNNENEKGSNLPVFSVVWNKTDTFSFKVSVQFVDPSLTVVFV